MEALVWLGPERLAVQAQPDPVPQPGEVVIAVEAAGICGSEVEGYLGRQANRTPPLVMGHEFAGVVTAIGAGVDASWSGRRVTVNPLLSCGSCASCRNGNRNVCERRQLIGLHRPGGFGALVAVPATTLVALPDGLDARLAALAEPLANGVHAVRLATLRGVPDRAIVLGAGTIGLAALQAARAAGIAQVTVAEPHAGRRAQAAALGATGTASSADEITEPAALVIDAVGRSETRARGVALTRAAGTYLAIGLHADVLPVSFHDLIRREIAIQGSYAYSDEDFATALHWLAEGRAGIGPLEPVRPLSAGPAAFAELARGATDAIKIFIAGNAS
ncbi:MAG: alcohol dehydrogenase catalytic domain-containing protein [Candidatus Limnocylindrales bacterium]